LFVFIPRTKAQQVSHYMMQGGNFYGCSLHQHARSGMLAALGLIHLSIK